MTGALPTRENVVKQVAMRRVHYLHPAWPVRMVLHVALREVTPR